jgi:hypothetical protein
MADGFASLAFRTPFFCEEPIMSDFTGRWFTTFGRMELVQSGEHVKGTYSAYQDDAIQNEIAGEVGGDVLKFRYREPYATGTGWFKLKRHGMFSGRWIEDNRGVGSFWHGHRDFDGVWDTSFGLCRLFHEADRVIGYFEVPGGGTLECGGGASGGTSMGRRCDFRFQTPQARGEIWLELDEQQMSFKGKVRQVGERSFRPCGGQRLLPVPELQWLVVLEAHWQRMLQEKDYSLGDMLREFFARVRRVDVRHRFFASEGDLETWCREILYLVEPVTVVVATHGTPDGINGHDGIIGSEALVKYLRHADNVTVLHFSACCIEDSSTGGPRSSLDRQLPFPISGYAAYTDWAASALVDFTYLDLILEHYLPPDEAASQVKQLLPFAGDRTGRNCRYPATRFRFWPASDGSCSLAANRRKDLVSPQTVSVRLPVLPRDALPAPEELAGQCAPFT